MAQDNFMYEWKRYKEYYDVLDDGSIKIHTDAPNRVKDSFKLYRNLMDKVNGFTNQKTSMFSIPDKSKKVHSNRSSEDYMTGFSSIKAVLDSDSKKKISKQISIALLEDFNEERINKFSELPFWVAMDNETEAGFICAKKLSDTSVEICKLSVLKSYEGTEVKIALLKECENWCYDNKIKLIKCVLNKNAKDNISDFYISNGFHCLEEDSNESFIWIKQI